MIRLCKHWLAYFLGNERKNYATEAMNLLCNLKCNFPTHIACIVTYNRVVKMTGKEGCAKALNQLIKNYNPVSYFIFVIELVSHTIITNHYYSMIKETMHASGANSTHKYNMEDVSLLLMDVAIRVDRMFECCTHS